jgi:superfamily I DNA and/or RNA helicase
LQAAVVKIKKLYKDLLKTNALCINARRRQLFLKNIEISMATAANLNAEQKLFKKNYAEGRKILENEFSKSMRYKSIRELSSKESNLVIKDLKPIWLMSPLSISDSIPLDTKYFDVVIFDEASQITVEEGIPALYRAPQTIIVGDEKQMPPTNFFNSKTEDTDDIATDSDDTEGELLSADADSLLVQGAKKLYSTMLCWHYRSSYETLISYSNHAFYNAELLTIPDKAVHDASRPEIIVQQINDASLHYQYLLDRSISYHFLQNGIYDKRSNESEANYITKKYSRKYRHCSI